MNEIKTTKKTNKKGFTLVELVVVIAILAILAAIAIPVVSNTIASSARSSALSDAQTLELALKEADAMIQAGDTSVYESDDTVAQVIEEKSLQSIGLSNNATTRTIDGTEYTLVWSTKDDKCYFVSDLNEGDPDADDNLDKSVDPGSGCVALVTTQTINSGGTDDLF